MSKDQDKDQGKSNAASNCNAAPNGNAASNGNAAGKSNGLNGVDGMNRSAGKRKTDGLPADPYDGRFYKKYSFRRIGRIVFNEDGTAMCVDISNPQEEIRMPSATGMMLFVTYGKYELAPGTTKATPEYTLSQRWDDFRTGNGDLYGDIYGRMKFWAEAGCDEYLYFRALDPDEVETVYGKLKATILAHPPKLEFDGDPDDYDEDEEEEEEDEQEHGQTGG